MSIRTKVIGCLLVILALFISVTLYSYLKSRNAAQQLVLVNELYLPLSRTVVELQGDLNNLTEGIRRLSFKTEQTPQSSAMLRRFRELYPYRIAQKLTVAERLLAREPNESQAIASEFFGLISRVRTGFDALAAESDRDRFETRYTELKADLTMLAKNADDECQKIIRTVQNEGRGNLISNLLLSTIVVCCGIVAVLLSSRALMPLPHLIQSIRKFSDGDYQGLKVKTTDKNEIALLAREFNLMFERLRERDQQIQRQQLELLRQERLAAIGQLSAEIVHEIRNPLNSLSLNIDWLESELKTESVEIAKTLKSLAREIEHLNQITESYLVRAKVPVSDDQKTEVNDLLNEMLGFSQEEDRSREIEISRQLSDEPLFVRTDRCRLKQAFLNVLKNAREAMPNGGRLEVETSRTGNVFEVKFADTGYGMNEPTRRKAFQPFFTTKTNGTGMGLMLTKTIVEEANGMLQCESQLGRGTTFIFQFPV